MVVKKEDIHHLVDRLPEFDQKTAFDFLQYLIDRSGHKPNGWAEIDNREPDDEPLSEKELRQLNTNSGYVTGEDAKREFGLQVDLP
ncbi:hypothetical protein [Paenibacillus agricola]|uniref:XRE family transcriptional regulator n=1 Tax=Paenibacillus agricola TaxID=2716264 RepID=A0ABX0JM11_9BACL|nr:hypothetical protein [Paenibacillus agricola]NHN35381.1 hypothetical protein [Paenibacillus agricola]